MIIILIAYVILFIVLFIYTTFVIYRKSVYGNGSLLWLLLIIIFQLPGILIYFFVSKRKE